MTGGDRPSDGPVRMFTQSRAPVGPVEAAPPPGPPDIGQFSRTWGGLVEQRLLAIEDNTFDLAEQVRGLGRRVVVALFTAITAIAALVTVALYGR